MKRPTEQPPEGPGSYQFLDAHGRVIYVGKATSLRSRLASYFADPTTLHPRTASMVATAERVEWIETRNELEALMLEFSLIKQHRPRFNVRLRDDKSYPFLAVTLDEPWPRATVMRGTRRKGVRYFGPYAQAWAIRDTLDSLLRSFPVRTCSAGKFRQHERLGRPCLLYHIEKCSGPCVKAVDPDVYRGHVADLMRFLSGDGDGLVDAVRAEMTAASAVQDYERAARMRDRIGAMERVLERQQMVVGRDEDLDVIGIADDELEASVQVFTVRNGRVLGRHGFVLDKVEDLDPSGLVARVLESVYAEQPALGVPPLVLVPVEPTGREALESWLTGSRGTAVEVRVPLRGDKRLLHETVTRNAAEELVRHRTRRAADHTARSRALVALQDALGLPESPLRIECYDMAHLQGSDYVGSMVVLEDGLPQRREYRRFKIRTVEGNDDYAAMREVLTRRLQAYLRERDVDAEEPTPRSRRFAYPPQLLLVDGGLGQLGVAVDVVGELGLADEIPVAAIAKRFEEVYRPGSDAPVLVPRGSDALFLLQVIRDEAHRFANAYHRELRGKRMRRGALDGIPGLGEARKKRLAAAFGGVAGVRVASLDDLHALPWLPERVADAVFRHLHSPDEDAR